MKDSDIVALFFNRNETALRETEKQYRSYCTRIAGNILGNPEDAEECVSDAMHAAWNSIPPQKPGNLKAYLGKLTREISISRLRKNLAKKRCPPEFSLSLDELAEIAEDEDFSAGTDTEALSGLISDFLRSLPQTERILFVRRYWYCDSITALCRRFGFGESKIKMTLKRTRDKLSEVLMKEGYLK